MPFNKQHVYRFLAGSISQREFDRAAAEKGAVPELLGWMRQNYTEHTPVLCQCRATDGVYPKLDVCLLKDTLYLRRRRGSHSLHAYDCQHRVSPETDEEGGGRSDYIPGVRRSAEGCFSVGLSTDLFPARAAQRLDRAEHVAGGLVESRPETQRSQRGRTTLLGLLQFLLDEAETAYWHPLHRGRRTAMQLAARIERIASRCEDTQSHNLTELVRPFHLVKSAEDLRGAINSSPGGSRSTRELIVIAPLVSASPPRWQGAHAILQLGGRIPPVWMPQDVWDAVTHSYGSLLVEGNERGFMHQLWVAITLRAPARDQRNGIVYASSAAVVAMTEDFIPVQSTYEAEFARYLVEQGREFTKPLRYCADDERFPDFILHDTRPAETHIEVLGFLDEKYRRRIEEKRRQCIAEGLSFLTWDAVRGEQLPLLPPISRHPV